MNKAERILKVVTPGKAEQRESLVFIRMNFFLKNYFYGPYISKISSKHSDEFPVGWKQRLKKRERDVISWADVAKYDLEVQNQGLHLSLANNF